MLGFGIFEILIILVVAFLAFGPERIPTIIKSLARVYGKINNFKEEIKMQIFSMPSSNENQNKQNSNSDEQ